MRSQPAAATRWWLVGLVGAVVVIGTAALIFRRTAGSAPRAAGPGFNVLLITLDTTRADHLGCYGHPAGHTPNIDRLAAHGTLFAQCTAGAPSTLPSHATILTGVYPFVHGVRDNVGFQLSQPNITLTEVLKQTGYSTAAYVGAFVVGRDTGLDQGFDTYDDTGTRHERPGNEVCDGALAWLRAHAADRFFMWVHLFDPHAPYAPPEPFRTRFAEPYVGEIAFADRQVGRLLDELRHLNLDRSTLVVLTADHGEGLGEHGEQTHLYFLYDTTLTVPLIFHCPGQIPAGARRAAQVRLIDVAPTILAFLGQSPGSALPDVQGSSLLPLILAPTTDAGFAAYSETLAGHFVLGASPLRCLRADGWKYIHAPRPELYHVAQDPGELTNLAERESERGAQMCAALRELIAESPPAVSAGGASLRPDAATRARLASLGYLGGDTMASDAWGEELEHFAPVGPDPKDHRADFAALGRATTCLQEGRAAEAEAIYRQLATAFPGSTQLEMHVAYALSQQARFDEAVGVYLQVLQREPEHAPAHYALGKVLTRLDRRSEAIQHFVATVTLDPDYAEAHYDLGVALRTEGRGAEAAACFREAVRIRPSDTRARVNLGAALAALGQPDAALEQYRAALRVAPNDATIHFNIANTLLRRGDAAAAIAEYEVALQLDPSFTPARRGLQIARQQLSAGGAGTPPQAAP